MHASWVFKMGKIEVEGGRRMMREKLVGWDRGREEMEIFILK